MAFTPKQSDYIKSSQLCGTFHTVTLPVVDKPFLPGETKAALVEARPIETLKDYHHHVEQATYLEWLNSKFENEFSVDNPLAKTCQDCHMSKGLEDPENDISIANLETRIAVIQDNTYPDAEHLASHQELNVRLRNEYSRHNFSGLNVFLVEMFNQFDNVLGVRKRNVMTGTEDLPNAIRNFQDTANNKTARLKLKTTWDGDRLEAKVLVTSDVGHRFPSGVGFRRAFLELQVLESEGVDGEPRLVWSSGRTNSIGMLVDAIGEPLSTEFFADDTRPGRLHTQQYQPHHEVITSDQQVQVYETLLNDSKGEFTTSFIHGCTTIKDNRILPRGWSKEGPAPHALTGKFLRSTWPVAGATTDPLYMDGSGSDETIYSIKLPAGVDRGKLTVQATLYYQAIPPYFLKQLFDNAPDSPAVQRLHYICGNLKLQGTVIEDWKLKVASAEVTSSL